MNGDEWYQGLSHKRYLGIIVYGEIAPVNGLSPWHDYHRRLLNVVRVQEVGDDESGTWRWKRRARPGLTLWIPSPYSIYGDVIPDSSCSYSVIRLLLKAVEKRLNPWSPAIVECRDERLWTKLRLISQTPSWYLICS